MSPKEIAFKEAVVALKEIPSFNVADLTSKQAGTLIRLYASQPLPTEKLPYSRIFERMVELFNEETEANFTAFVIFGFIIALRKAGRLPTRRSE